jgi:hypothetical protein
MSLLSVTENAGESDGEPRLLIQCIEVAAPFLTAGAEDVKNQSQ